MEERGWGVEERRGEERSGAERSGEARKGEVNEAKQPGHQNKMLTSYVSAKHGSVEFACFI